MFDYDVTVLWSSQPKVLHPIRLLVSCSLFCFFAGGSFRKPFQSSHTEYDSSTTASVFLNRPAGDIARKTRAFASCCQ